MPPRFGQTVTPAGAPQAPVSTQQPVAPARPPEASYQPRHAPAGRGDEDGVAPLSPEEEANSGGQGGGRWPKREDFAELPAGNYTFVCNVNSIVRWHFGVVLTFRVLLGDERGRELDWNQSPPATMSDKGKAYWRRTFFGAYAAGGWTVEPDAERKRDGWTGWEESSKRGADGKPLPLPPYDRFFVLPATADGSMPAIPLAVEVDVQVDAGYERFPKIIAVRLARTVDSHDPVQAPIPFKTIDWIAERNGWVGTVDDKISASGKTGAPVLRLDTKQVPKDAAGLRWYADALRSRAAPAVRPTTPVGDNNFPF